MIILGQCWDNNYVIRQCWEDIYVICELAPATVRRALLFIVYVLRTHHCSRGQQSDGRCLSVFKFMGRGNHGHGVGSLLLQAELRTASRVTDSKTEYNATKN